MCSGPNTLLFKQHWRKRFTLSTIGRQDTHRAARAAAIALLLLSLASCSPTPTAVAKEGLSPPPAVPDLKDNKNLIRVTGTVRAVRVFAIQTPQIAQLTAGGPMGNRLTLVTLVPNGSQVKEGDTLADFDNTRQLDEAMDIEAKYDELGHQIRQKAAQNLSEDERRMSDLKQAEADLAKAKIQLTKGPVLADVERLKNEIKAASARARVESLTKSHAARHSAEAAAKRIIELQQDRQKVALERAKANLQRLTVKAPLGGMVALENIWKGGTMGHPREGDLLWPGQPLMKIFDPSEMVIDA
jgi:multidrug efflux pump subunit AcrA (membrane-fusion protein)